MATRLLSLVVPAYKQEKTITKDIKNLNKVLSSLPLRHEIIVVVDGYVDKTYQKAKKLKIKNLKVIGYQENKGKGYAIKQGMEKAKGEVIGFIDAGMDLDPKEISIMVSIMDWNKADIVIGSKLHPDSRVKYPFSRKVMSYCYRLIIKIFFDLNVTDTQVGLKLFRRPVVKKVFPKIEVKAFAFDVEVLAVAQKYGYDKIYESPVKLRFRPGSITSANYLRVGVLTLVDTLAVFYRMKIKKSY